MFLSEYLRHKELQSRTKNYKKGDILFRQGEMGGSMYLILEGIVQLFDETDGEMHLVGTYGPGQFFGEKCMLVSPIQRYFTAQARMGTFTLEFSKADLPSLQSAIPDFLIVLFQAAAQRLEKAYSLTRILKTKDLTTQIVHAIIYCYRSPGLEATAGRYISIVPNDLANLLGVERREVDLCFGELVRHNALVWQTDGTYLMKDEKTLLGCLLAIETKKVA